MNWISGFVVMLAMSGVLAPTGSAFAAEQPAFDAAHARQFSLSCRSTARDAALPGFYLDVNLDTRSYFGEVGGLDELGDVDDHRIVLRRHFLFEGVPGYREEEYSRDDGYLYWNRGDHSAPGAICKVEPPREGFRARRAYRPQASE